MSKTFQLQVNTINGEFLEFPETYEIKCDHIFPVGSAVIKNFDENMNVVAKKVFLVRYGQNVFGCQQFKTVDEFYQFLEGACQCCPCVECLVLINGCFMQINGCFVDMC